MIKGDVGLIAAGVTKANFSPIQKKFQQEILSIFGKGREVNYNRLKAAHGANVKSTMGVHGVPDKHTARTRSRPLTESGGYGCFFLNINCRQTPMAAWSPMGWLRHPVGFTRCLIRRLGVKAISPKESSQVWDKRSARKSKIFQGIKFNTEVRKSDR
jgi:hypothetical protein